MWPMSGLFREFAAIGDTLTAMNGLPLGRSSGFEKINSTMAPGTMVYLNT